MKYFFRKAISVILAALMLICSVPLAGLTDIDLSAIGTLFASKAEATEEYLSEYYIYTVYNGEATITDVDESISGDIIIPSTLGGYPVTNIGNNAFKFCTSLTSITIPDNVTNICNGAFANCTSLTSVTIGNSVTSIGIYAFVHCDSLTSITIPNSVTTMGNNSFANCNNLTSVKIGNGVKKLDDYTFTNCTSLSSVTISNGVTNFGVGTFQNCTNLSSITIPDSVTCLGVRTFFKCISLQNVTIPDCVTTIGDGTFLNCTSLSNITIPDSVTSIGGSAFYNSDLTDVYYTGTEDEWNAITFGSYNEPLLNATIHYNYVYTEAEEDYGIYVSYPNPANPEETIETIVIADSAILGTTVEVIKEGEEQTADIAYTYEDILSMIPSNGIEPDYEKRPETITIGENNKIVVEFKLTEYTAIFNGNGGYIMDENGEDQTEIILKGYYGQPIEIPGDDALYREGHYFMGWDEEPFDTFTEDTVHNAMWEIMVNSAIFVVVDEYGDEIDEIIIEFEYGEEIVAPEYKVPDGYEFSGWDVGDDVMGEDDILYTATINPAEYSLSYEIIGLPADKGVEAPATQYDLVAGRDAPVAKAPVVQGYTFDGWYYNGDIYYCDGTDSINMPASDVVLTGTYIANMYTLSFDTDGAEKIDSVIYNCDEEVASLPTPTKEGYEFLGWFEGNTKYEPGFNMPANDFTLTAKWIELEMPEYTITYMDGETIINVAVYEVNDVIADYRPETQAGKTFKGWLPEIPKAMPAEDLVVTAVWETNKYTVTYDANGGIFTNEDGTTTGFRTFDEIAYGTEIPVPETNPTRDGYEFIGWVDENGDEYQFSVTVQSDLIFFAKYKEVHVHTSGEWVVTTEPTETTTGIETQYCTECDAVIATREIAALEHVHVLRTVTIAATCTVPGMEYDICESCGEVIGEPTVLPVISHTPGEWVITHEPDCTNEGEKVCYCTECETLVDSEVIEAKGHVPGDWEIILEPTVETEGKKIKKCTVCGLTVEEEIIPKKIVVSDENTGVSIEINGEDYDGEVNIVVKESFDGSAFNLINSETDALRSFIYDITMTVDGKDVQPEGEVTVRLPLPEGYNPALSFIYHVNTETGKVEKMNARYEEGYLVFETTHFSYYAIVEEGIFTAEIRSPSETVIKYGDSIVLHLDSNIELPEGYTVEWSSSNDNFSYSSDGVTCTITPEKSGDTVFTAVVYDSNGNEVCKDEQTMTSKAGFFQKIIAFFKMIFRLTKVFPEAIKF